MSLATRIEPAAYDLVTGATYTVSESDLDVEFTIRRSDGVQVARGWNKRGVLVTLPLNVTLCGFCDGEVSKGGECPSCETIHIEAMPELDPQSAGKWL